MKKIFIALLLLTTMTTFSWNYTSLGVSMGFFNVMREKPEEKSLLDFENFNEMNCSSINISFSHITDGYIRSIIEINSGWVYGAKRTDTDDIIEYINTTELDCSIMFDLFMGWGILLHLHDLFFISTGLGLHTNVFVLTGDTTSDFIDINLGFGATFCLDLKISEKNYIKLGIFTSYDPIIINPPSKDKYKETLNILPSIGWVWKYNLQNYYG
ncbi:MAG: hypothetical protein JXR48_11170 [Candidatus Delongbacteria bacterium]|nr:hypothetical protein [Candidatus Delongbacteria bacterium]